MEGLIIAMLITGVVLGIVLKKTPLFYTFATLDVIYIVFAPKSLVDYGKSGLRAMLGQRSPGLLLLSEIVGLILIGMLLAVAIRQIIVSIKHLSEVQYKITLGINILAILSFVTWFLGLLTISAGLYRVPTLYHVGLFSTLVIVTIGFEVFGMPGHPAGQAAVPTRTKKRKTGNINFERYTDNPKLLDEHLELGIITREDYQQVLIAQVLAENSNDETGE